VLNLLTPVIVVIIQRLNCDLPDVLKAVKGRGSPITAIGLPSSFAQGEAIKAAWSGVDDVPLILLHHDQCSFEEKTLQALVLIHERRFDQPLAVVYANNETDPELSDFRESLALKLSESVLDLQQLEYSPTWRKSPPRIR